MITINANCTYLRLELPSQDEFLFPLEVGLSLVEALLRARVVLVTDYENPTRLHVEPPYARWQPKLDVLLGADLSGPAAGSAAEAPPARPDREPEPEVVASVRWSAIRECFVPRGPLPLADVDEAEDLVVIQRRPPTSPA